MPLHECPGPDRKKPNLPEEITCPKCGEEMEIWSNDECAICPACKAVITRDQLEG